MNHLPTISTVAANLYVPMNLANNNDKNINNSNNSNISNKENNNVTIVAIDTVNIAADKIDSSNNNSNSNSNSNSNNSSNNNYNNKSSMSDAQAKQVLEALKRADAEVKAHEQAHMAAGGGLTGGVTYSYKTGPDGKRYAVAGEVSIDTSSGRTPEETKRKAQTIKAAALAPANPSAQDRKVAAMATTMLQRAMSQILQEKQQQAQQEIKQSAQNANADNKENNNNSGTFTNPRNIDRAISSYSGVEIFGK